MAPLGATHQTGIDSGQTASNTSTPALPGVEKNHYNRHGLPGVRESPRAHDAAIESSAAAGTAVGSTPGWALLAIAVRAARSAVRAVAAGGAVHVEPVGEAGAAVATSERIASATGQTDSNEYREERGSKPTGHEFDPPRGNKRRTTPMTSLGCGALDTIDVPAKWR